jgi:nitroimidazol reductase NimA-like FMN-containing flavoprotein (pyridoxamine 5'-phosphate oxidase superfamily)
MSQVDLEHGPNATRVMTRDEMERLLEKCSFGRLGLFFQNEPYVVPVSYKYNQGRIFFHGAKRGKKMEFLKGNNRVCFEVDEWEKPRAWASVICYGTATLRDDIEASKEWNEVLTGQKPSDEVVAGLEMGNSYIGIIQIEDMTGKCRADFSF